MKIIVLHYARHLRTTISMPTRAVLASELEHVRLGFSVRFFTRTFSPQRYVGVFAIANPSSVICRL